jgi:hypothetical protein
MTRRHEVLILFPMYDFIPPRPMQLESQGGNMVLLVWVPAVSIDVGNEVNQLRPW